MNDFLVGCFIKLEQFRPSADELVSHPWVVGEGAKGEEGSLPYSHFHDLRKKETVSDDEVGFVAVCWFFLLLFCCLLSPPFSFV